MQQKLFISNNWYISNSHTYKQSIKNNAKYICINNVSYPWTSLKNWSWQINAWCPKFLYKLYIHYKVLIIYFLSYFRILTLPIWYLTVLILYLDPMKNPTIISPQVLIIAMNSITCIKLYISVLCMVWFRMWLCCHTPILYPSPTPLHPEHYKTQIENRQSSHRPLALPEHSHMCARKDCVKSCLLPWRNSP